MCQGGATVSLVSSVTPISGNSLKWYTSPTSASLAAAPQVSTSQTGPPQVFYVSQTNTNGCESSRAAITYMVYALPNPPSVVSPVAYCQNATAQPLQATPSPGGTLNFYTVSSGGTSTTSLTPQTQSSNIYYVSQTVNGCESGSRAPITVTINAQPTRPAVTTPVVYCQFATASPLSATAATNNTLIWYALNGQQLGSAPTPPTTVTGVTSYSVNQRDPLGCISQPAIISVTINAKPTAPATAPLSACLNTVAPSLPTSVTATGTLKWYTASVGGVGATVAPVLSTTAVGSTTYYVSQTSADGCESDRAAITYTVNPLPSPPVPTPRTVLYCQGATATPLTASGQNLKWYLTNTTSVSATSITPSTTIAGSVKYFVSQTNGNGCESPRDSVTVITSSRPVAPTVVSPVTYCQNAVATSLSATAIPNNTLKWYGTDLASTTFTTQATVPSTTTPGTFTYYVTQTDGNSCESDKAGIVVRVNPLPTTPVTTSITVCQNATTVSLPSAVVATGILKWYTTPTGGVGSTTAPVLSTSAATTYTYYVSQTDGNGCESNRATLTATVKPLPAAPTVSLNVVPLCQSSTPTALTAMASTGGTLKWYDPSGNTFASIIPSSAVVATTVYQVSQLVDGCEGPKTSVSVVVIRKPDAPTVAVPAAYCQFAQPTALSATAAATNTLKWYAGPTGGAVIPTPTPSTSSPGTTTYYVTQTDLNGCESDRASIAVQVKAKPAPPVTAPVAFCANQVSSLSAVADNGGTLNWYGTSPTSGTATATAPIPSTSVIGAPVNYYVSQTVNGCESDRAVVAVTIKALPVAPTVSATPVVYCQGVTAQPLSATPATNGTLNWYLTQTGGTSSPTAFTPSTASNVPPTSYYYVSQTVDGCEGPRSTIAVTINPKPTIPTVTPAVTYCQNAVATSLTATASGTLRWYTDPAGSPAIPTPTPSTTSPGVTNYYVTQTSPNGCESDRATIVVTINALPAAPVVSQTAVAVCQNSTPVTLTATASTGGTLNWYMVATGTPSPTAPAPPTTAAGSTMTYYVSQTVNGCEGPKTAISVTVTPLPAAPTVSTPVNYCQNAVAQPLTATASTGGTLNWYDPTGNALASVAPTPATTTPGPVVYQVSQTVNGCEGPRASITVAVSQAPVVPTATTTLAYCQSSVPPALTATASTGGTLNWYTVATGGTASSVAPIPNTTTAGVQTYYVSQTINGCESNRVTITVTINALPAAPVVSQTAVAVCQNSAPVTLTATASTGGTLNWYTTLNGTPSATAPAPPTTAAGSTMTYYVSQTVNGCEGAKAAIIVTVTALPAAPAVSTPVNYCQNAVALPLTATASAGGTLNWYSPAGGPASSAALTPSTTTAGQQTYSVSQTVNGCEGPKASIIVNIYQAPAVPATTAALAYCQNSVAPVLTATPSTGGTINWYTVPTGGTASSVAPIPNTTTAGVQVYYVSQTVNGCESDRTGITVTIKATPVAPTPVSPTISLCQSGTATPLTAVPSTGGTLNWYTVVGGTASPVAPTPNTSAAGQQTYYVSQTISGCEGPTTPIVVTVNALPAAPVVAAASVSFCQNSASTALTAQPSPGGTLYWYAGTGGTGSTTAPVPPTSTAGTQTYLVSQRVNGCEGPQTTLTVTINPLPAAPTTSPTPITYCQGVTALPLTAAGTGTLNWYTTAGGTPSQTAPVPPTTTPGLFTYYVSQTINGCEGPQATIVVLINATPAAPTVGATPVYCQNGTSTALAAIPSSGGTLEWYTTPTGGSPSSTPPTPPVGSAGTVTYYVSQNIGGCEGPRVQVTATIKPSPAAPTVTPTLAYCENSVAPALTATPSGGTLNWYTVPTGGTGSATPPVPPTNTVGTQSYYVSQITADGCEGPRAAIAVTIRALPAAPTTTPLSICQNATPPSLALSVAAFGPVNWYTTQTGGTPSTVAPVPATANPGPITYYVSQTDANGCESQRSLLLVTVTATPAAPVVPTSAPVCQNTAPIVLTAAGQGLKWYADATSTGSLGSSIVQQTGVAGTFAYYVSQTVGSCEGPRALAQVVVNASPAAPVVQATQSGCQDAPAQPLTASGTALQWYDANDSQIGTPTPDTRVESTQTYSYKVTQTVNGCVSPKATVLYTVTVLPVPTVTTPVAYCQNQQATPLQASGSGLRWVDPSGAVTTAAPTPPTSVITAGASYSVSQTNAQGCESRKAEIRVTVNAQAVAVLSGTTTVSYGSGAPLTLTLSGVGPYSYTLSNGITGVAESASVGTITRTISVTPTASTTYTLLGVSNGCGAGNASGSATVTVDRPAIVAGGLSVSSVCAGGQIDVPFTTSGTFTPGNTFVVEMALAGDSATRQYRAISTGVVQGPVIQTTVPINYAQGLYFIRVRATNTNYPVVSAPSATTLNVRALPTASISASKTVVYRGERVQLNFTFSGDAPWQATYRDRTGVRPISPTTNPYSLTFTADSTTTYKLLSVTNGCGTGHIDGVDSVRIRVDILTADESPFATSVKVYPVPTNGDVTVEIDDPMLKNAADIQLTRLNGEVAQTVKTRQRQTVIKLGDEPAGIYFLQIRLGDRSTVRRILKQ
ncbi:T9SS type A sorting domain-containing protein [Spirosoma rhododendri]|uniref:T9SS type A sorting domain-containing protein n=1 Tax=Spirosoma rhododendri TaxID=2728024 RepID=A0A7L5DPB4_9BACT|nr:T9SS type A sorting domain-containing protein [Spirosoma rhododendri]QJD80334.1 T9SS type A sorting domain-containing protein [Spirosoma rhododendri]